MPLHHTSFTEGLKPSDIPFTGPEEDRAAEWLADRMAFPFVDMGRLPGVEVRPIVHERPLAEVVQLGKNALRPQVSESVDIIRIAS